MKRDFWALGAGAVCAVACGMARAQAPAATATLKIDPAAIVHPVSPSLYGLMTEEINHSYDGGLYAELLMNRTFRKTWDGIEHWDLVRDGDARASMESDPSSGPSKALSRSLKLMVTEASERNVAGVTNSGFWGIPARAHTSYRGSVFAQVDSDATGPLRARLIHDASGAILAEAKVPLKAGAWQQYNFTLTTGAIAASSQNHLELTVAHPGTLRLQLASLMPPTFAGRVNGNRVDLMEKMTGLHPTFLRLPGGNYLEGDRLSDWYNWKETIGPLVDRPGHQAPWSYWSTDGLGLLEYLEWCEDLKIEPLLAVYAGYALHGEHVAAGKDLEPYVQAALDEVEYVTGDTSTKWGAERAKDGHPAPFPLHYIEVGNEDWLDKSGSYKERWPQFARALHAKYPQYKLIATEPVKAGNALEAPDVIDDHYYKQWGEMLDFTRHYDGAPRNGPKVFVGEWATLSGTPTPDFGGALADAAWMTAMERNSDLIIMAAYAPMLVNVNAGASQWGTNLIGYDALTSYASPSYYAQAMFAAKLGSGVPESSMEGAGERFYYSATVDDAKHHLYLKLVNASSAPQPLSIDLTGSRPRGDAQMMSLHAATYEATNTLSQPQVIRPESVGVLVRGGTWSHTVPALTIEVIDVSLQ